MAKTSTNVRYMLHAAILLFAQLDCMLKLKHSKFALYISILLFHLNEDISCAVFVALPILVGEYNSKTNRSVYTHC